MQYSSPNLFVDKMPNFGDISPIVAPQDSTPDLFIDEGPNFGDISPIAGPRAIQVSPASVCEAVLGDTPRMPGLDWPSVELFPQASEPFYENLNNVELYPATSENLDIADLREAQEKSDNVSTGKAASKKPKKIKVVRKPRSQKERIVNGEVKPYAFINELPCIVCERVYVSKKFLQRHKRTKHRLCKPVHQLDCEHCGAIFPDVESFTQHCEETDGQIKEYNEKGLYQKTVQKKNAEKHTRKRKMELLEERLAYLKKKQDREERQALEDPQGGLYTCNLCNFTSDLEAVKTHLAFGCHQQSPKEEVTNFVMVHDGQDWEIKSEIV